MKACLILIVNLQILYVSHVPFTQGREGVKTKSLCPIFLCPIQGRGWRGLKVNRQMSHSGQVKRP